jgi:hypothetical protein
MTTNIRERAHEAVDKLSETQLVEMLRFVELLASAPDNDTEPEEIWLLMSGALKRMVDEIEDAPPPIDDWRSHLYSFD